MKIKIPDSSLVVLVGASGAGKSTFAKKHFLPTEVLNSDYCRGLVSDDEDDQTATPEAFEVLHFIAAKRLQRRKTAVVDATNVHAEDRKHLVSLAREHHALPIAIVLNLPERVCQDRNKKREDRNFGGHVIRGQQRALRRSIRSLRKEGFRYVYVLKTEEEVEAVVLERAKLWTDRREERGPFDIVGDVHGCCDELEELLLSLGCTAREHEPEHALEYCKVYEPPEGRRLIFVGDLVDRGPRNIDVLRLVYTMVHRGHALCVPGNHDVKFLRKLWGKNVQLTHGLAETVSEVDALPENERKDFEQRAAAFLDGLISHFVLDEGKLVVAHAGMREDMQGRASGRVREFALYGETTGETDEFGFPVRWDWASEYRGKATVVYGHTPVPHAEWINRTINIDTGCVFGGKLTALRYPEKDIVQVDARETYAESKRPFLEEEAAGLSPQHEQDDLLWFDDVGGKRQIDTRLRRSITIRAENAGAALEVMTRFAANPKWLVYLPPTMSPCETSQQDGWLEHPQEAFSFYRNRGIPSVVCEEKHMGSRAVLVVCKDEDVARERFGIEGEGSGICYTRTGRRFFSDRALEDSLLDRVREAMSAAGTWEEFETDWICLDCEIMPWSAKARDLLQHQYAAVGAAATESFAESLKALKLTVSRGGSEEAEQMLSRYEQRERLIHRYVNAYREYCWPVNGIDDFKLAPFHVLASEGKVHADRDHLWHMSVIKRVCEADASGMLLATPHRVVDLSEPTSEAEVTAWWEELTAEGGEGMVVKPKDFVATGKGGLLQPAVKCRGREYLRIIYGPEYTLPEHLQRLRKRGLSTKRSLALREFALGIEGLERFVRREPLRRVHECVFGILALESEPVDPRL